MAARWQSDRMRYLVVLVQISSVRDQSRTRSTRAFAATAAAAAAAAAAADATTCYATATSGATTYSPIVMGN